MTRRLLLTSTSTYRASLLSRLGVPFTTAAPTCDEDALKDPGLPIDQLALMLAREKVRSLVPQHPDAHLLGGDQVVELDGQALGKPGTRAGAIAQLRSLAGKRHRLWTAIVLRSPDGVEDVHVDLHTLTMRTLNQDELARYVDADLPLDCAGSDKIESRGIALMSAIEGADFTSITGIPLIALTTMLRAQGFQVP
jgi:septum formation protein